jgi:hypothetical protein
MDIKRKLEIVATGVSSITNHTDADSVVRVAALDQIAAQIATDRAAVIASAQAEAAAALAGTSS